MPRTSTDLSRRSFLGMAALTSATAALLPTAAHAAPAGAVQANELAQRLLAEWASAPGAHPYLGDFRHAGYRRGGATPHPRVVAHVKHYGARGDGVTDDAPAFNAGAAPYKSAPAKAVAPGSTSAGGFRIGQNVQHAKFGLGVIVSAEGGAEARVQVNFGAHGMKWLALEYAKLTPV